MSNSEAKGGKDAIDQGLGWRAGATGRKTREGLRTLLNREKK